MNESIDVEVIEPLKSLVEDALDDLFFDCGHAQKVSFCIKTACTSQDVRPSMKEYLMISVIDPLFMRRIAM